MHPDRTSPFPSLPGTQQAPRGLFIDRWGTLLDLPSKGYASSFEEVRFTEGALEALFRASRSGWYLYLIGNEDAVAQGKLSDEAWLDVRDGIEAELGGLGIQIRRFYACLDHPEGKGDHCADSVYLLPNTGILYHAAHTDGVDLAQSWVLGDSTVELVSGWRAGCRIASVETGTALSDRTFEVDPEFRASNLAEALMGILGASLPATTH